MLLPLEFKNLLIAARLDIAVQRSYLLNLEFNVWIGAWDF
jgi:hypothetical protein